MDKPDWKYWQQKGNTALWEAVALSCNVEPRALQHLTQSEFRLALTSSKLGDRLRIAKSATTSGAIKLITAYTNERLRHNCVVDLRTFAAWAESIGWKLPKHFSRPDRTITSPQMAQRWPWGDYETELLRKLADAAQRWWINYDPSDQTTAPTNARVAAWLVEKGAPKRVAEIMAQILRADGLPTGPRR